MSINLWTSYYDSKDEVHQKEILRAIELNLENPKIDAVYLFCEIEFPQVNKKIKCIKNSIRPTFGRIIECFQDLCPNDYNIIINSDIVLDYNTTDLIKTIEPNNVYALSRYTVDNFTYYDSINMWNTSLDSFPHENQGAWVFYKSQIKTKDMIQDIEITGSDSLFAYLLNKQGVCILNPCLSIKIYHLHSSYNIIIKNEYINIGLFITPSKLDDIKTTLYMEFYNNTQRHFTYYKKPIKSVLDIEYNIPIINDLAVGLVFFNYSKSKRILMNYLYTVEKLKLAKIPYYTIELLYNNSSPEILDAFHVRSNSCLFQKEHLCKVLEKQIPESYTKLLFIDIDLVFSNADWYNELSKSLNSYEVVQPFTCCHWLDLEYKKIILTRTTCVIYKNKDKVNNDTVHFGFAWAFQRSYYREVGMYTYAIIGSGDGFSSMLFLNHKRLMGIADANSLIAFLTSFNIYFKQRKPSLSYISGNLLHLWHGTRENRKYSRRFDIFKSISDIQDILTENSDGAFEINNDLLKKELLDYFIERNDDEIYYDRTISNNLSLFQPGEYRSL